MKVNLVDSEEPVVLMRRHPKDDGQLDSECHKWVVFCGYASCSECPLLGVPDYEAPRKDVKRSLVQAGYNVKNVEDGVTLARKPSTGTPTRTKGTCCYWAYPICPHVRGEQIFCRQCPAMTQDAFVTFDEAKEWWSGQHLVRPVSGRVLNLWPLPSDSNQILRNIYESNRGGNTLAQT